MYIMQMARHPKTFTVQHPVVHEDECRFKSGIGGREVHEIATIKGFGKFLFMTWSTPTCTKYQISRPISLCRLMHPPDQKQAKGS
jgi:hypothetical protein